MTDSSADPPPLLDFTPVPRKILRRHDGLTVERQRALIAALAESGSVSAAARKVGVSNAAAYNLYNHPQAASLRAAWDRALEIGTRRIHDVAMERALDGVPVPIYYRGEQVGEQRRFSDRVLGHLLRHHAFGHHPSPVGRRSRAAAERHAAENCPTCRDRKVKEAASSATARNEVVRKIDLLRGHLLTSLARTPAGRAAWELIVGPTDWTKVEGWDRKAPTQFVDENMTRPSTIVTLAMPVDRTGARVSDLLFRRPEKPDEEED